MEHLSVLRDQAALWVMRDHDFSQLQAYRLFGFDPKTVRRDHPPDSLEIRKAMKGSQAYRWIADAYASCFTARSTLVAGLYVRYL